MKITIHRGSNEIGGTCIELATGTTKILLDLGLPLNNKSKTFDVAALRPDAVIISHPHQDHYGLLETLGTQVPTFISIVGKRLIDAPRMFLHKELLHNNFQHFTSWQPFRVRDFTITPYLVDHSACDAYAFLIEVEGKRIFYSGDFRGHGRKDKLYKQMVKHPPPDIDLLFMEGTMLGRSNDAFPSEESVEKKILETIRGQENITFLISSSQNIDRITSAYRACKKAQKILVIDTYTAWILEQLKLVSKSVPAMDWEHVRVYTGPGQGRTLLENPDYFGDFRTRVYLYQVKAAALKARPADYLYLGKLHMHPVINLYKKDKPVNVIYSQWRGYLKCSNEECLGAQEMAAYQNDPRVNFVYAHTSGHATMEDLQEFADALQPKALIPIHTEHAGAFREHFENVLTVEDGNRFDVDNINEEIILNVTP